MKFHPAMMTLHWFENRTTISSKTEPRQVRKSNTNYTELNYTELELENQSVNPSIRDSRNEGLIDRTTERMNSVDRYQQVKAAICENVQLDFMTRSNETAEKLFLKNKITEEQYLDCIVDLELVDRIIGYMTDAYCSDKPVRVNQERVPPDMMRHKIMSIDIDKMREIAKAVGSERKEKGIRNLKGYVLSSVYNA